MKSLKTRYQKQHPIVKNAALTAILIGLTFFMNVIFTSVYQNFTEDYISSQIKKYIILQKMRPQYMYNTDSAFMHHSTYIQSHANWHYLSSPYINHAQMERI